MSNRPVIQVLYTCDGCNLKDAKVAVPARTTEDVVTWTQKIMAQAIADDHFRRSPHCYSKTMATVKIPITGANKIGGPALQ